MARSRAQISSGRSSPADIEREIVQLRERIGQELGRQSGHVSGINLNLGDIDEEYVPDLRLLKSRTRIFERMANDPQVRGQLRAITMTMISGVRWKAVGGTKAQQDLVNANLLGVGPSALWCSSSFQEILFDQLGMLIYGFTLMGKTREVVGDRIVFRDLTWLHPRTVDENGWITDDHDNLVEIRRSYRDGKGGQHSTEPLPASEVFISCWDRRGPNWEGNSFIRPMYRPWKLNEMAEKIDMIDLQNRGVGIPIAKLSGAGGTKERDTLLSIVKSLRGGDKSRSCIVLEKDEEVKYLLSEGTAKDAAPILAHHRTNITKSAGGEYMDSGNTATGSRAAASSLATGFFVNVDAIRVIIEDQINRGVGRMPGLTQELQDLNFDDIQEYTRIEGSRVSPTEQLDNVPLIQDAIAKGAIPPSLKIANVMLERLGWPQMTKSEWDEAMKAKTSVTLGPGSPAMGGPGRPDGAGTDPRGRDDAESRRMAMRARFAESRYQIGDRVQVAPGAEHDEEMKDAIGTVRIIEGTAIGVEFDDMPGEVHKWYVAEELIPVDKDSREMRMAEKKTHFGGSLPSRKPASYPWLRSMTA